MIHVYPTMTQVTQQAGVDAILENLSGYKKWLSYLTTLEFCGRGLVGWRLTIFDNWQIVSCKQQKRRGDDAMNSGDRRVTCWMKLLCDQDRASSISPISRTLFLMRNSDNKDFVNLYGIDKAEWEPMPKEPVSVPVQQVCLKQGAHARRRGRVAHH